MSVTDIQDAGQDVARKLGNGAEPARERAERVKQALQDTARKGAEAARTQTAAATRKMTEAAQERPIASLSTALAVGLFVGFAAGVCAGQMTAGRRIR